MTTVEEALADVKQEGSDPFKELELKADQEKETPSESQTEKEPKVEKPVQGDNTDDINIPFNKRWEKHAENLKTELDAKHQEEMASLRQEFEAKLPKTDTNIPDWFKELYGDNEIAWQKYDEHEKDKEAEIEKRVIERQDFQRQRAEEEVKYWNKWVDDEVTKLQDEGLKFERNELIKTMLDYRPTDEKGNFDFKAGYRIFEALKAKEIDPARSEARKKLADTTTKTSPSEKGSKDYMTSNELRGKSWNQI